MAWNVITAIAAVIAVFAALLTISLAGLTVFDSSEAHAQEMGARKHDLVVAIRLQRSVQVGRLTDVLTAMARATYDDELNPPVPAANSKPPSMVPVLQAQLRAELAMFRALGGPDLRWCAELATKPYRDVDDETARPDAVRELAGHGLGELEVVADTVDQLSLRLNEQLRLADLVVPVDMPTQPRAWVLYIRRAVRPG